MRHQLSDKKLKSYDGIIFDLDGTLWDASEASSVGWNEALRSNGLGHVSISPQDIRTVSGMPFQQCVASLFPDIAADDVEGLASKLDVAEQTSIEKNSGKLFDGVANGIKALSEHYSVFIVSNCQSWYLESFLVHSSLRPYIKGYDCYGDSQLPKSRMISNLIEYYQPGESIYIGDTLSDQEAAYAAGIDFGYATYGFGQATSPAKSFDTFSELVKRMIDVDVLN
jgi:phosphoglycolate phosphatase